MLLSGSNTRALIFPLMGPKPCSHHRCNPDKGVCPSPWPSNGACCDDRPTASGYKAWRASYLAQIVALTNTCLLQTVNIIQRGSALPRLMFAGPQSPEHMESTRLLQLDPETRRTSTPQTNKHKTNENNNNNNNNNQTTMIWGG